MTKSLECHKRVQVEFSAKQYARLVAICQEETAIPQLLLGLAMAHVGNIELQEMKQKLDTVTQQQLQSAAARIQKELLE